MRRRSFFSLLIPGLVPAAQTFGPTNSPRCPVCKSVAPTNTPPLLPVTSELDGTISTLTNLREIFCAGCGVRYVVGK